MEANNPSRTPNQQVWRSQQHPRSTIMCTPMTYPLTFQREKCDHNSASLCILKSRVFNFVTVCRYLLHQDLQQNGNDSVASTSTGSATTNPKKPAILLHTLRIVRGTPLIQADSVEATWGNPHCAPGPEKASHQMPKCYKANSMIANHH